MKASRSNETLTRRFAGVLRQALEQGATVEIDGLGTFVPGGRRGVRFVGQSKPRVFIAYVQEDLSAGEKAISGFRTGWLSPLVG